ncbi:glycosyltransferase family protein 64 protein C5 [Phalaenopsis equestris]|uniref:glycosyltransferase family protein 64 protein C5 n=1 Tax=Phalaenopsis equestris TaxID=78828 RepID=UPI0009E5B380|nr:glycosyltransferase family protein 64 protein C5 [Phalaenopsis equestris]XP_020573015.1 glycosyltransferase family protein 64 protein C5 [Phalaenopsis equestris]
MTFNRRIEQNLRSTAIIYLLSTTLILGVVASLFAWLTFPISRPSSTSGIGCRLDGEGSWSIGIFYGGSPLALKPIEDRNVWRNESAAWPVANPVFTCAMPSNSGFPSNFVADPFLFIKDEIFYLFFETKNSITLQGDIGVAMSKDKGVTWTHLGTALDEEWHLSYPYVFDYQDQIYMLPEGSKKGDLRLYRAVEFPLKWKLENIIMKKPLVDSFIVNYEGYYWLWGSDSQRNGELQIWYSNSPLGSWKLHKQTSNHSFDKGFGARNAGRPFIYNGELYRPGQDCRETYGRRVRIFKVKILAPDKFEEVEVPLGIEDSKKDRNSWNGARFHHMDVQQLSTGEWIGVMDGDRVRSGDAVYRLMIGYTSFGAAIALSILSGIMLSSIKLILPVRQCIPISGKRNNIVYTSRKSADIYTNLRWLLIQINRSVSQVQGRINPKAFAGRLILVLIFLLLVSLTCVGTHYLYGGIGAEEPYQLMGHYSQFTLLTMTYDARLWNLKMYVKHYSKCSSVREIVVVWNKGRTPVLSELDSAVPVRIRVEKRNSLNNRFKLDPLIKTRAILELDDDIMISCNDVERGFLVWREHPYRIVGFYPRLAEGDRLTYRDERYARGQHGYNMILTGAAFMDAKLAFGRYYGEEAVEGREFVDDKFNCEDVLLNFLYANASSGSRVVEYVKASWTIDTSKFSGVAISKNTNVHYKVRSECLVKFAGLYGNLGAKWGFGSRGDGWDV